MNNLSFWLLPPAALLLIAAQFMPGGGAGVGWTMYAPLSTQAGPAMDLTIFAVTYAGYFLDHGFDQHHNHHPQHARPRADADEDSRCSAGPG